MSPETDVVSIPREHVLTLALVVGQSHGFACMCWSVQVCVFDGILGTRVGGQGPSAKEHLVRLSELIENVVSCVLTWLSVHFIVRS